MAKKVLNVIIPLVVYPFDVMFSFGETDEQLKKSLDKVGCEWSDKMEYTGMGRFCMNEKNQSLIRVYNIPKTCEDYGTLQHEIFHAVTYIMDRVGMKLKLHTNDEAYAYLIGYLTAEIYKKIN
jgi:hypothetical protein